MDDRTIIATLADVMCQAREHFENEEPPAADNASVHVAQELAHIIDRMHGLTSFIRARSALKLRRCPGCTELHVLATEAEYDWMLWRDQRS